MDAVFDRIFLPYHNVPVASGQGSLSGVRVAVKDIYDVAGYPSGWGNPVALARNGICKHTAPSIKKLFDAGAQFVGKTHTDELAYSLMGQNSHFGTPPNAAAPDRVPGGSSSGSASAVAFDLVDLAIGSDTGGSVRIPASFQGIYGIRTTHDAIDLSGAMPLAPSYDVLGWFAKNTALMRKIADIYRLDAGKPFGECVVAQDLTELSDPAVQASFADFIRRAEAHWGTSFKRVAVADGQIDRWYWILRQTQGYEAWRSHRAFIEQYHPPLGPGILERFEYGKTITNETYGKANEDRTQIRHDLIKWVDGQMVFFPTAPNAAPSRQQTIEQSFQYRERTILMTCPAGLAGLPQISMPYLQGEGGPVGISLLGPPAADIALLDVAHQLGKALV